MGHGAFGVVGGGVDKRTGKFIAIKKIKNVFRDLTDAKRSLREIKLLMFFNHPNIVSLVDIIIPTSKEFDDLYLVFEMMHTDLEKVIRSE